jgi:hypothetical protein
MYLFKSMEYPRISGRIQGHFVKSFDYVMKIWGSTCAQRALGAARSSRAGAQSKSERVARKYRPGQPLRTRSTVEVKGDLYQGNMSLTLIYIIIRCQPTYQYTVHTHY